jgi:plastocyanin
MHTFRMRFLTLRQSGVFLTGGLLAVALTAAPAVAQSNVAPAAMVEGDPTDINSWNFAAQVPVGGTITWNNQGSQGHTVTATDNTFDSGLVAPGTSATLQFDTPGIFAYTCTPHPWMKGTVVVSDDAPSASPMAMVEGNTADINSWGFAVSVSAGQSINWVNRGGQAHTVTAADGTFDTGLVAPGSSGQLQFDTPGVYAYACMPHPWMKGNVAVN